MRYLAETYHWTPSQIADMPPEQIVAFLGDGGAIDYAEAVAHIEQRRHILSLGLLPPGM